MELEFQTLLYSHYLGHLTWCLIHLWCWADWGTWGPVHWSHNSSCSVILEGLLGLVHQAFFCWDLWIELPLPHQRLIAIGCRQHVNGINLEDVVTLHVDLQVTCTELVDQPLPMFVPESIVAFGKHLTDSVGTSEWHFQFFSFPCLPCLVLDHDLGTDT